MRRIIAIVMLCYAAAASGQVVTSAFSNVSLEMASPSNSLVSPIAIEPVVQQPPTPKKQHMVDRPFAILLAVSAAFTIADIELTANCVATSARCREANPLLGRTPTRARLYGVNAPLYLGGALISRALHRKNPDKKLWVVPLVSATAAHAVGVVSNSWAR